MQKCWVRYAICLKTFFFTKKAIKGWVSQKSMDKYVIKETNFYIALREALNTVFQNNKDIEEKKIDIKSNSRNNQWCI